MISNSVKLDLTAAKKASEEFWFYSERAVKSLFKDICKKYPEITHAFLSRGNGEEECSLVTILTDKIESGYEDRSLIGCKLWNNLLDDELKCKFYDYDIYVDMNMYHIEEVDELDYSELGILFYERGK